MSNDTKRALKAEHVFYTGQTRNAPARFGALGRQTLLDDFDGFCLEQERRIRAELVDMDVARRTRYVERMRTAGDADHRCDRDLWLTT